MFEVDLVTGRPRPRGWGQAQSPHAHQAVVDCQAVACTHIKATALSMCGPSS